MRRGGRSCNVLRWLATMGAETQRRGGRRCLAGLARHRRKASWARFHLQRIAERLLFVEQAWLVQKIVGYLQATKISSAATHRCARHPIRCRIKSTLCVITSGDSTFKKSTQPCQWRHFSKIMGGGRSTGPATVLGTIQTCRHSG